MTLDRTSEHRHEKRRSDLRRIGTAFVLEDERQIEQAVGRNARLKYDSTGKILLVPQPSDDPNDPLVSARTASLPCAGLNVI